MHVQYRDSETLSGKIEERIYGYEIWVRFTNFSKEARLVERDPEVEGWYRLAKEWPRGCTRFVAGHLDLAKRIETGWRPAAEETVAPGRLADAVVACLRNICRHQTSLGHRNWGRYGRSEARQCWSAHEPGCRGPGFLACR